MDVQKLKSSLNTFGIMSELFLTILVVIGYTTGNLTTEHLILGLILVGVMGIERKMVFKA